MKRLCIALALACSACTTTSIPPPVTGTANQVVLEGTRALVIAHHAYQAAATTALSLIKLGAIKGQTAAKVRSINAKCLNALRLAGAAQDDAARLAQVASLLVLVVQLDAILRTQEN